jgi:hypothetical protein
MIIIVLTKLVVWNIFYQGLKNILIINLVNNILVKSIYIVYTFLTYNIMYSFSLEIISYTCTRIRFQTINTTILDISKLYVWFLYYVYLYIDTL